MINLCYEYFTTHTNNVQEEDVYKFMHTHKHISLEMYIVSLEEADNCGCLGEGEVRGPEVRGEIFGPVETYFIICMCYF